MDDSNGIGLDEINKRKRDSLYELGRRPYSKAFDKFIEPCEKWNDIEQKKLGLFAEELHYNFPIPLKSTEAVKYNGSINIWRHEIKEMQFLEIPTKHKCTCDFHTVIMVKGCQCGGI